MVEDYQCGECGARYGSRVARDRCELADSDADRAALLSIRRHRQEA